MTRTLSDEENARLEQILKDRKHLSDQELSERIKWLDTVLGVLVTSEHPLCPKAVRCLQRLCRQAGRLPYSYQLKAIAIVDQHPISSSALSDVYEGVWQGTRIAIKALRIHRDNRPQVQKVFQKEVILWKYLDHPNIVPLLGITDLYPVCLVSRWMVNGTITSFLKANARESRVRLALEMVSGLQFMHDLGIVHGDLKSTNVLVNEKSEACLVDFGLATAVHTATTGAMTTDSSGAGGTLRWMAPELCSSSTLDEDAGRPTQASDVYALAMVVWELFSGEVPFFNLRAHAIREAILGGRRPERPHNLYTAELDDPIWEAVTLSWAQNPKLRSDLPRIRSTLQYRSLTTLRHLVQPSDLSASERQPQPVQSYYSRQATVLEEVSPPKSRPFGRLFSRGPSGSSNNPPVDRQLVVSPAPEIAGPALSLSLSLPTKPTPLSGEAPTYEPNQRPTASTTAEVGGGPPKASLKAWWNHFNIVQRAKREPNPLENDSPSVVFGKPLRDSLKYASVQISTATASGELYVWGYIPVVIAKCGLYLKEAATEVEGIFRVRGSDMRVGELQATFETPPRYGKSMDWKQGQWSAYDIASVFRRYLTQMPEPVIPTDMYYDFRNELAKQPYNQEEVIATYKRLINNMPRANQYLLLYVLDLLSVFARKSDKNRMDAANLSVIFRPGLLSYPEHEMMPKEHRLSQEVLEFLIAHQDWFMLEVPPPPRNDSVLLGASTPAISSSP